MTLLLTACMPVMEFQSNDLRGGGIIYLPLPEGLTEGGAKSSESLAGSRYFAERLAYHIGKDTQFQVIVAKVFIPPGTLAERKDAVFTSAKAVGADYVMVIRLGEYNNAASMSFVTDSFTIQALRIYDVDSGALAFGLKRPHAKTISNMTSLNSVLDRLAQETAKSISKVTVK